MKTYTLITFSLFFNGLIIAQKFTSLNFGKIPSQDLSLTECPFEKGAEAMVLDETCEIYIAFIQGVPTYYYEVHKRIKIFNQAGFDQGQVNLDYINKIENISNINAQVIQTDGTITKLKDDNIFTEKITEKKYRKKIAFPNLQSGSIIEYKYKLKSEKIYVLREWYFQKSIPTRNSQVIIKPEESLTYTPLIQQSLRVYQQDGFYLAQNLESIRKVPYFDRPQDHACKIKFQLSAYMNSDRMMVPYLTDWKQIVTLLRNDPEFYYRFTSKSASSESWSQIEAAVNSIPNEFDKAKYIYDFVQENINWDEKYGLYPDKNPDKCFQLKKGNSASINAAAINLMKRAKLKVYPVVSNPSSEGGINKYYPDLENFGHVFGLVNIDNKNIFFDASYSKLPFGILGEENSIDEGLLISDDNHSWVEIPKRNFTSTIMIDASLDEENNVTGNIKLKQNNYAFAEDYSAYKEDKEGIFWTKRLSKGETNATCEKFVIENIDYSKKELKASFDFNLEHEFIESDDKIYLPINFYGKFEENPFKETTRNTPINFKSTFSENYILNLRLPEGYKITNVPKNIYLQTSKKEITLMLSFTVNPTSVLVNRKININQDFFFENMYNEIKLIFEEINNRSDEMLILEKN